MSKKFVEFSKGSTKECVVLLERLDKKLLSQYLQKYDSNQVSTEITGFVYNVINQSKRSGFYSNNHSTTQMYSNENTSQKLEKSALKIKFKRRKRKIKQLSFRVNELPNEANLVDRFLKKEIITEGRENLKCACFTEDNDGVVTNKAKNTRKTNESLNLREVRCLKRCKTSRSLPKWKNSSKFGGECNEKILKNTSKSKCNETDFSKDADIQVEVIKEITTPCKIYNDKEKLVKSTSENPYINNEQDSEEDEYDSREDGEDDRNTIIFEESPQKDTDLNEVFGFYSRKGECAIKKVKNKEATDGKKLVKFKRKSLEAVRKSKIQTVESRKGEEVTEEAASKFCVSENYLKEVCSLVKRLHELYRIISQLQRELPKNDELAVHFSKVIRVQEENFIEEIRKSQKSIIECYEKLLVLYDNSASEVFSEISQRALLGIEDVSNIISRCFLLNEVYEVERNNASPEKQEKQNYFLDLKNSDTMHRKINENLIRQLTKKRVHNDNHLEPQSHPHFPSEGLNCQYDLIPKPMEPIIPRLISAEKNAMSPIHSSSDHAVGSFFPSYDDYQIQKQISTYQKHQDHVMNPRLRQPLQHDLNQKYSNLVPWSSESLISHNQSSIMKTRYSHSQYVKPTVSCNFPVDSTVNFHQHKRPDPESSGLGNPRHPFSVQYFYLPNYIQQKTSSNQFSESNLELLSSGCPTALNKSTHDAIRQRNNLKRDGFAFSSKIQSRITDPQKQVLTCLGEARCPFGYYLNDSVRFTNQKLNQKSHELYASEQEMCGKHCSIDMKSRAVFENSSNGMAQEVLDPTVPQKLTMKNCRLQAGPPLERETDAEVFEAARKLNPFQSFKEEMKNCSGSSKENSKSRVYICAQNGCKMPGLRICKGCQSVIYCGETCQLKHWVLKHKSECYQLRELRGA